MLVILYLYLIIFHTTYSDLMLTFFLNDRIEFYLFFLFVYIMNIFSQDYYEVYNESSKLQISSERWSLQTWNSVYWGLLVDAPSISLSRVAPVYLPYIWGLNNETIKKGRLNPSKLNIRDRLSDTSFEDSVLKVRYFDESFSQKSFTSSNILVNVT